MTICPKCGYTRRPTDTAPDYECPKCGVVYAKVAQAAELPEAWRDVRHVPEVAPPPSRRDGGLSDFVERLRLDSLYPTFRQLVSLMYFLGLILAGLALLGGVAGLIWGTGAARYGTLLFGVLTAAVGWVLARVMREMSLMLADLSDAAVRIASKTK